MTYKEIPLTQGKAAIVDVEDYEYLNQWKWFAHKHRSGNFYAERKKNGVNLKMHREIMKAPKGTEVDHKNGNGLDNRRWNLRICNRSQNAMNRGKQNNNKSEYKGVHCYDGKYRSRIQIDGNTIYLGYYATKEEAAEAYNEAAKKYFGEFAKLNMIKGDKINGPNIRNATNAKN